MQHKGRRRQTSGQRNKQYSIKNIAENSLYLEKEMTIQIQEVFRTLTRPTIKLSNVIL